MQTVGCWRRYGFVFAAVSLVVFVLGWGIRGWHLPGTHDHATHAIKEITA
jgi:hypothetical protein